MQNFPCKKHKTHETGSPPNKVFLNQGVKPEKKKKKKKKGVDTIKKINAAELVHSSAEQKSSRFTRKG